MKDYQTAEQTTIGALLQKPELIDEINVMSGDFANESYAMIHRAMVDMQSTSVPIDVVMVAEKMSRGDSATPWLKILGEAYSSCVSTANIKAHAKIIKDESQRRKIKSIAGELLEQVDSAGESIDVVDDAVIKLMELSVTKKNYEYHMGEVLSKSIELIESAFERAGTNETVGVQTGLIDLDNILSGFYDSDLTVIGARPAMGKTALMLNFGLNANVPAGIISTEQPCEQLGVRMIAIDGRMNSHRMRTGKMQEADFVRVTSAVANIRNNKKIWINDKYSQNIAEITRQARKWKHNNDIKILFVDYIQNIKATNLKEQKHERVGEVADGLKNIARELDIPVVALAQVSREVEKRPNKRPNMGDLKDSGIIEQVADNILLLYRDEVYNDQSPDAGIAEIEVAKNRHGPIGFVKTAWRQEYMRFENVSFGGGD